MGRIEMKSIEVPYLNEERKLRIYLPNNYDLDNKFYPVLYMHDGMNLYFDEDAFYGYSWKVKDTMEQLESEGFTDGIIVVGIDVNPKRRLDDYSPWKNSFEYKDLKKNTKGGDGDKYGEFIVNTLKPYIDKEYRTLSGREHTSVAGSSMGGFISTYLGFKYPDIFSKIGIFSVSSWFAESDMLSFIDNSPISQSQMFYIQLGTQESNDDLEISQIYINCSIRLYQHLIKKGIPLDNIELTIGVGDIHNAKSWSKYFPEFIKFAFS